jgi:hypothetical protein
MPPTWTTLVFRNPEPVMVRARVLEPAGTRFGLMDVMAGVGVVLPPPPLPEPLPEPEPEPEPPPAQPPIAIRMPSAKTNAEKRAKKDINLQDPGNLTEGAYLSITAGWTTVTQNT